MGGNPPDKNRHGFDSRWTKQGGPITTCIIIYVRTQINQKPKEEKCLNQKTNQANVKTVQIPTMAAVAKSQNATKRPVINSHSPIFWGIIILCLHESDKYY